MGLELLQRLAHFGIAQPNAEALRQVDARGHCDRSMTYGQLCRVVSDLAGQLRSQFPPGSVVVLCHPNELEFVAAFLATLAAGGVAFPIHPNLPEAELLAAAKFTGAVAVSGTSHATQLLRESGVHEIDTSTLLTRTLECRDRDTVASTESVHLLSDSRLAGGDGPGLLLQSSGTTGLPKIVRRSGAALDAVARGVVRSVGLSNEDRVLGLVAACHSYGVENVVLAPLFAGASVHLCSLLEPHALLEYLNDARITVFPGVPTMFEMLVRSSQDELPLRSLRRAYSAGATLPMTVFDAFAGKFGVQLGQLFGMTEVGSVTFNDPGLPGFDPASVGLPMDGVGIRIIERTTPDAARVLPPGTDGEIAITAPSMLTGYVRGPHQPCELPAELSDGFFLTGDQGHLDSIGRLTITGRLKLVIDVGGLKVNLLEVEALLRDHPDVQDCVVVPIPVSETVSRLKALVVPAVPQSPPSFDALRKHLRSRLSPHKVPRLFELRTSLPRSPGGKILRYRLQ